MAHLLATIREKIKESYGQDSFVWFDRSYVIDWQVLSVPNRSMVVATGVLALSWSVEALPVFEREFSLDDPLIQHPHTSQQISGYTNGMIALAVPLGLVGFIGGFRSSVHEIHHGWLAVWSSRALNSLITEALKNRVGRLRPDFLTRCQWDTSTNTCTGKADDIRDGRRSFPSGHSSTAFTGMTFISLFLAGKTAALCFNSSPFPGSFLGSRLARLCLVLAPLTFSTWVAISRVEDYRHHKEDVIVGSMIGILSATLCYLLYWPNPFALSSFSPEKIGRPRIAVTGDPHYGRNGDYELASGGAELDTV
ncbi:lipid phosphate phosphatase 1 [Gloeopeniophorella convolvens]|nr:lipid phosphate phosphatase 1 [Gloeopeniophorella convolvens]